MDRPIRFWLSLQSLGTGTPLLLPNTVPYVEVAELINESAAQAPLSTRSKYAFWNPRKGPPVTTLWKAPVPPIPTGTSVEPWEPVHVKETISSIASPLRTVTAVINAPEAHVFITAGVSHVVMRVAGSVATT